MRLTVKIIVASLILLLLGIGIYHIALPKVSRCFWVNWSSDFEYHNGIYLEKNTPMKTKDSLVLLLDLGIQRNQFFWEQFTAKPRIIYCHSKDLFDYYANPKAPASAFLSPLGVFLVFSHEGLHLDIISHELCHAELMERIGWWKRERLIPTWFDEGLAMQLDYREQYSEERYIELLHQQVTFPELAQIATPATFGDGTEEETKQHYILAKHEVARWLEQHKMEGLFDFIKKIKEGKTFGAVY